MRHLFSIRWQSALCLSFITIFFATDAFGRDVVRTRSQGRVSGTVKRLTPSEVVIDVRGIEDTYSVGDVISIQFDDEPQALDDARLRIKTGKFLEAMKLLKSIDVSTVNSDSVAVLQDIDYYLAYCMAQRALGGAEALEEAGKMMTKFVGKNKNNYHFYEANEVIGDILVALNKAGIAEKYYIIAGAAPWPEAKVRTAIALARALQAQGKHDEAIKAFDNVLKGGGGTEDATRYRLAAQLGKAASLANSNRGEEGIKLVYDAIKAAELGDTEIHARAYNAMGDCYIAMGNVKEATTAFLHVDAMYDQHPPLHAEALARLASLWDQRERPGRASTMRKKLNSLYPNSKWVNQST